ncbi:MAG: four helix bundle protein [Chloroflexaceae bacterium]|jgi:four helix bundle protein|nr:four helix bundle protein [Chloroflexaceae bacterium]
MTRIERFEDLIAWQKARTLTQSIYSMTRTDRLSRDFGLAGQLQRASVSVMSNIAEGFERNRPGEFHQFLSIAKASCAEVRSLLYVALDAEYVDSTRFDELMTQAQEVARVVGGLRASVGKQRP